MKFIVAGNWKLNKNPQQTEEFLKNFLEQVQPQEQDSFLIFPPVINLFIAQQYLKNTKIGWGAQNVCAEVDGAFTGENSAATTVGMGATHVILGHSECRALFSESDALIAQKFKTSQQQGLMPVLCVGETLAQREAGDTDKVIVEQLAQGLKESDYSKPFIVAYEPVWAIGTGKVATPEQADSAHKVLKAKLKQIANESVEQNTPVLYGGSVKPESAAELSSQPNINGFLVGGASLKVDSFISILRNSSTL